MPEPMTVCEVTEDLCATCGRWPPVIREEMRLAIDELPLIGQVCDKCLRAFWLTLWAKRLGADAKRKR